LQTVSSSASATAFGTGAGLLPSSCGGSVTLGPAWWHIQRLLLAWCQFFWRSHGCRWGQRCTHAHSISEFNGPSTDPWLAASDGTLSGRMRWDIQRLLLVGHPAAASGGTSSGCFWWGIQLLLVGHPAAASGAEAAPLAAGAASSDAELQWELQVAAVAEEQENAEMQWLQTLTDS